MSIEKLKEFEIFGTLSSIKKDIFFEQIQKLCLHHYKNCTDYKNIINKLQIKIQRVNKLEDFPIIPVNLFKLFDLLSVQKQLVVKKLVSSGTSGQNPSKIYLDKINALMQTKVLDKIFSQMISDKRLPMLIVDRNPNLNDKGTLNAKSAAIYGFSIFGKNHFYLLDKKNEIDLEGLTNFMNIHGKDKFLIFGFTSQIFERLIKNDKLKNLSYDFSNGILLHGGGWKKIENLKISSEEFKKRLEKNLKLKKVHNYYGLVEQTGSIFFESPECGYFHTSIFSDVIIRDSNFKAVKNKTKGLIQLLSVLPTSYPGHNILTEDIGEIFGEDDCKCGLKGKYFKVYGRAKKAEVRGCSDVT